MSSWVALAGVAASGCSDEQVTEGPDPSATVDAQLDGPGDSLGAEVDDTTGQTDAFVEELPVDVPAADVPQKPYPPCTKNDDCPSGYCLPTPDGDRCAPACAGSSGCNAEFQCQAISAAQDVIYVCVHPAPYKCKPCKTSADCNAGASKTKGLCVDLGKGAACMQDCTVNDNCVGNDVACAKVPDPNAGGTVPWACIPKNFQCPCPEGGSGSCKLKNEFGTCSGTYACAANLPGPCSGTVPSAETCNNADDDCDGKADDEVPIKTCNITGVYGTCAGKTLCVGGQDLCQGAGAAAEVCNGIDDNCSSTTDEGFADTDLDAKADCVDDDDDGDGVPDAKDLCPLAADPSQVDSDKDGAGNPCDPDDDGDDVPDLKDNCPLAANVSQTDTDKDGLGDACDCDLDGDGVANLGVDATGAGCPVPKVVDVCPAMADPKQTDLDLDGLGDACDPDQDGDGVANAQDNCPLTVNVNQADNDKDGFGDPCDTDDDNDAVFDPADNCPLAANASQTDTDGDKAGDACDDDLDGDGVANAKDNCPGMANAGQVDDNKNKIGDVCEADWDSDGLKNDVDNCPWVANPDQMDLDLDTTGDACDCDVDGDGKANPAPGCPAPVAPDNCPLVVNVDQADLDGDGFGDACDADLDGDGDPNASDCQPKVKTVSKLAVESCNGIDDDCDGQSDEAGAAGCKPLYFDADGDGFGVTLVKCLCGPADGYTATQSGDCNDKDGGVHPAKTELCGNGKDDNCNGSENDENATGCAKFYTDVDGDGYGVGVASCLCSPSGNFSAKQASDCLDSDTAVNPGQVEKCLDGKDNNCDGLTDDAGCQGCSEFFKDGDQDNYGVDNDKKCLGAAKYPYTAYVGGDCNDGSANFKPGATEVCNGADDNCDGQTDPVGATGCTNFYPDADKDSFGAAVTPVCYCKASGDWSVQKTGDCNDNDAAVNPAKQEACNGFDDNCNGLVDEGVVATFYKDNDGDGYGSVTSQQGCKASSGYTLVSGDCNDFNKNISPGAKETCNLVDDDCNSLVDDGLPLADIYADVDGDGFGGKNAKPKKHCLFAGDTTPLGYSLSHDDCDDSKSTVYPAAPELCDGILNNCKQSIQDAHCPKKCEGVWPVFVGGSAGYPAIAQLNDDNALEVVARNEGKLRAFKANGSVLWETALPVSYSYPALADVNGDSTVDVISPGHGGNVYLVHGVTGAVLATINVGTNWGHYGAAAFDIDRDGVTDFVPTGGGPYKAVLMNADLSVKAIVALPTLGEYVQLPTPGIFDLSGDGMPEILYGSGNWTCQNNMANCKGRLYVFDVKGAYWNDPLWQDTKKPWFEVAGYPKVFGGEGFFPLFADVDGDGVNEVHHAFAGSSTDLWKKDGSVHPQSGKTGLGSFPMPAPVDALGNLDTSGKLRAMSGPMVDIDGDGDYEMVANSGGGLAIFKQGKIMDGYPLKVDAGPQVIGDINRDGQLDILFSSGSNNAINCYTLGGDTYADARILTAGTVSGLGRNAYPTMGYDPFEPNDVRTVPFVAATSKKPLFDSRAFRISALRDVFSSGGGWTHKLQAVLGDKGDRDHYVLYGGIINVTLVPMQRDYDLYLHIFKDDGTFLDTWKSEGSGTGSEGVQCHSVNNCPPGAGMFIIEVRGKDANKDFGPWPYWLTTNWAQ